MDVASVLLIERKCLSFQWLWLLRYVRVRTGSVCDQQQHGHEMISLSIPVTRKLLFLIPGIKVIPYVDTVSKLEPRPFLMRLQMHINYCINCDIIIYLPLKTPTPILFKLLVSKIWFYSRPSTRFICIYLTQVISIRFFQKWEQKLVINI